MRIVHDACLRTTCTCSKYDSNKRFNITYETFLWFVNMCLQYQVLLFSLKLKLLSPLALNSNKSKDNVVSDCKLSNKLKRNLYFRLSSMCRHSQEKKSKPCTPCWSTNPQIQVLPCQRMGCDLRYDSFLSSKFSTLYFYDI